jgi:hypothetical protein
MKASGGAIEGRHLTNRECALPRTQKRSTPTEPRKRSASKYNHGKISNPHELEHHQNTRRDPRPRLPTSDEKEKKDRIKTLERARDLLESTHHKSSRRSLRHERSTSDHLNDPKELDNKITVLIKSLNDSHQPDKSAPSQAPSNSTPTKPVNPKTATKVKTESQAAAAAAAAASSGGSTQDVVKERDFIPILIESLSGIYRSSSPPPLKPDQLCPSGKDNVAKEEERHSYPAWYIEPSHISFGVRGGVSRGDYYESVEGEELLAKRTGKYGDLLIAASFGHLIHPKQPANQRGTMIIEAVMGVEHSRTPSKKSIEWCTSPGNVPIDASGGSAEAKQCTTGVLGGPNRIDRLFGAALVGGVFTQSGAIRLQVGPTLNVYRRLGGPRTTEVSLILPLSLVSPNKIFKGITGIARIVPTVRWQWQEDQLVTSSPAFLVTLHLLAQRSFWSDALSWL